VSAESCEVWLKMLKRSASIDIIQVTWQDRGGGEQSVLRKERVTLTGDYVWGVNSRVNKHPDYFVWIETSEYVTRCCDNSSWQETSVLRSQDSCVFRPPFLGWSSVTKKIAKKTQKYFPMRYCCKVLKTLQLASHKPRGGILKPRDQSINSLIHQFMNSGEKILRSCVRQCLIHKDGRTCHYLKDLSARHDADWQR